MAHLVLSSGALSGTVRPALLTFAGFAVLAGLALLNEARGGDAPPLEKVPAALVAPQQVGTLTKQRTGKWATAPVTHGSVIAINAYDGVPDEVQPASLFVMGAGTVLRVDDLVDVSNLPDPEGRPWRVAVLEGRVVHVANENGAPLTDYDDFAAARHQQALRKVWSGFACLLILAPLLAFGTRIISSPIVRKVLAR